VDQFEEFRTSPQAAAYIAALLRLVTPGDERIRGVLTMRRDYLYACDSFPELSERRRKDQRVERERLLFERTIQLLTIQARRAATEANTRDVIERAAALALESIALARKSSRPIEADAVETVRNTLIRLSLAVLQHGSPVQSLTVLRDGRLASGGQDGSGPGTAAASPWSSRTATGSYPWRGARRAAGQRGPRQQDKALAHRRRL